MKFINLVSLAYAATIFDQGPLPEALEALKSTANVTVTKESWYLFKPVGVTKAAIVYYPGGFIDYRSYAPYCHALAENGYMVALPEVAINLAILSVNVADKVMAAHKEVSKFFVAGHSLGATTAAKYAFTHQDKVSGLVMLASYPSDNMTDCKVPVEMIIGTKDGEFEKVMSKTNLFNGSVVVIEGGNHGQMGSYGIQRGDGVATISPEEQRKQVVGNMTAFFDSLL